MCVTYYQICHTFVAVFVFFNPSKDYKSQSFLCYTPCRLTPNQGLGRPSTWQDSSRQPRPVQSQCFQRSPLVFPSINIIFSSSSNCSRQWMGIFRLFTSEPKSTLRSRQQEFFWTSINQSGSYLA